MLKRRFEELAGNSFRFLVDDYAFKLVKTEEHLPEMWVTFKNPTTAVTVSFELGSAPWIEIGKLERVGDQTLQTGRSSLELLLKHRAPEETIYFDPIYDIYDLKLRSVLEEKARQLRQYAEDFLCGDFREFVPVK